LTQEYLASVIDTYYGLWDFFGQGMWGAYAASNREELNDVDPEGLDVVRRFFSPRLTWMVYLSPELPSSATFTMDFDDDSNFNTYHAYKSRYIDHAYLLGTNDANIRGNEHNNCFGVNAGINNVDGGGQISGVDVLLLRGKRDEYDLNSVQDTVSVLVEDSVEGRDGVTQAVNVDILAFSDTDVATAGTGIERRIQSDLTHEEELAVKKCWALVDFDTTKGESTTSPARSPTASSTTPPTIFSTVSDPSSYAILNTFNVNLIGVLALLAINMFD